MKRVAVFGLGYVGCVTAGCLARDGHHVVGVDVDEEKVQTIRAGRSPVVEHGLDEVIRQGARCGGLTATCAAGQAVAETDMAMICVGTPSARCGAVSTDAVRRVVQQIGDALRDVSRPYSVVVRSTLLPNILEDEIAPLLAAHAGRPLGPDLRLGNNPEFLREATALADYDAPPFVLVGTVGDFDGQDVLELYADVQAARLVTDARSAALVKYACNAFHAAKVAFANEIGTLARSMGADGRVVMDMVSRDTKLNISPAYLRPGFAFGGSCLPKDVRAMVRYAQRNALDVSLLQSLLPSNEAHLARALERIEQIGVRRVGIIGLSYKKGTDDLRESPFVVIAERLLGRGHDVAIYDPGVSVNRLRGRNLAYIDQHLPHLAALLVEEPQTILEHAELLVVGTSVGDHLDLANTFEGPILDLRACLVAPGEPLSKVTH